MPLSAKLLAHRRGSIERVRRCLGNPVQTFSASSPLASEQPRTWACAIIHVLGQLNFLSDKASQPHMTMAEVCTAFGVGQSTASARARVIADALHTNRMDP